MRRLIAAGAAGLLIGFGAGRLAAAPISPPPSADPTAPAAGDAADAPGQRPAQRRGLRADGEAEACDDPVVQEELEALRGLTALQEKQLADMEAELYGQPEPWPDEVPAMHTPEAFEANLRDAVEKCNIPVDVVDFACEEPPCYAMLRRDELNYRPDDPWAVALNSCAPWQDRYGEELSLFTGTVNCPGGQEGFTMLAPPADWLVDWEGDPEQARQQLRRMDVRRRQAEDRWPLPQARGRLTLTHSSA